MSVVSKMASLALNAFPEPNCDRCANYSGIFRTLPRYRLAVPRAEFHHPALDR